MSLTKRNLKASSATTSLRPSSSGKGRAARRKRASDPLSSFPFDSATVRLTAALRRRAGCARPPAAARAARDKAAPRSGSRTGSALSGAADAGHALPFEQQRQAVQPEHEAHRGHGPAESLEQRVVASAAAHLEAQAGRVHPKDEARVIVEAAHLAEIDGQTRPEAGGAQGAHDAAQLGQRRLRPGDVAQHALGLGQHGRIPRQRREAFHGVSEPGGRCHAGEDLADARHVLALDPLAQRLDAGRLELAAGREAREEADMPRASTHPRRPASRGTRPRSPGPPHRRRGAAPQVLEPHLMQLALASGLRGS
jgi:hypothetical protein